MMEVVIVDDGNRLTVYELVERVIPCIIAKHYSENYIQGFRSTFRNLLAYCNLMPGFHTEVEEKGLVSMISGIPLRSTF